MFANGPGDRASIPGRVIPKNKKMVLDAALLNTQHYNVRIKDKVEQSKEWSSAPPPHQCCSYWKATTVANFTYLLPQSARAVERTDCFSAEGYDTPPPNECPWYDTKQSDGEIPVMLELWERWSTPSCHRSQVHSGPEW